MVVLHFPDPVVDLFKASDLFVERLTQELLAVVQAKRSGTADATDLEVIRVGRRGDASGTGASRRVPARRGRVFVERPVRSHVVVGVHERIEQALLDFGVGRRGFGGLGFEHSMRAFLCTMLLRTGPRKM